jgi:transcription elongation factor GreA
MTVDNDPVWMTQAALDKLQAELDELTGLDSAEDQARIVELRALIRRAEVGAKPDDGLVEPGMTVTIRMDGDEPETFLLGSRELLGSQSDDVSVFSPTSPLGQAIAGHYVGDKVDFSTPNGAKIAVEVLAASPYESGR